MDKTELNEIIETLRQLATETDLNIPNGIFIAYYLYKLADIIEGGTEK